LIVKDHPGIFKRQKVDEKNGSITRFFFAKVETLEAYVPEIYIFDSNLIRNNNEKKST